jgi:hypothetical protein
MECAPKPIDVSPRLARFEALFSHFLGALDMSLTLEQLT